VIPLLASSARKPWRCPVCDTIGARARDVADALRRIGGLNVQVTDGQKGEFTVLVDRQEVIQTGDELPSIEEAVSAVRELALAKQTI
jgi:hypothetical protein